MRVMALDRVGMLLALLRYLCAVRDLVPHAKIAHRLLSRAVYLIPV
jgi:hypothetical protein